MATVMIARYNVREDSRAAEEKENFLAMSFSISILISCLVVLLGIVIYGGIDNLYANTLNAEQLTLTKRLYILLVPNVALHLFNDCFVGIANGYEKFTFVGMMKIARILIRVFLVLFFLNLGFKSIGLVTCDLIVTILLIFINIVFCFYIFTISIKYYLKQYFRFLPLFYFKRLSTR